jgi:hypothetical protein
LLYGIETSSGQHVAEGATQGGEAKMPVFDDAVPVPDSEDRLPLNVSLLVITGLAVISWGFVVTIVMSVRAVL